MRRPKLLDDTVRLDAIKDLKAAGKAGLSGKYFKEKYHNYPTSIFNTDDLIYEEERNGLTYYVWCGEN